ncbi:MAG: serine hydroxymethyltransferase, partial [Planctomycetota bacterium]
DTHLLLVDLRGQGFVFGPTGKEMHGRQASECLERSGLIINRNAVPRDTRKPWVTSGIRMGTNVLAARGMGVEEMDLVAGFIHRVLTNAGDEETERAVQSEVLELTSRFPIEI